jgi:ankyrin repeat protein
MHYAAFSGHTKYIQFLIDNGQDINALHSNQDGLTPLAAASLSENAEVMQFLLDRGALINGAANNQDNTPLSIAIDKNKNAAVKWLLEHGANPDGRGYRSRPFEVAMKENNIDAALMLLDANAEPNYYEQSKSTPFHDAVSMDSKELLEKIIASKRGKHIDTKNYDGWTALGHAIKSNKFDLAKVLIKNSADTSVVNGIDENALAVMFNNIQPPQTADNNKAREGFIRELASSGVDLNQKNSIKQTPLAAAVDAVDIHSIKTLISVGANTNDLDASGSNILHLVSKINSEKKIIDENKTQWRELFNQLSAQYPEYINAKNADGLTPLHMCALSGDIPSADILIKNGADVRARDKNGQTVLHHVSRGFTTGRKEMADYFISKGAEKFAKDNAGRQAYTSIAGKETLGLAIPLQSTVPLPKRGPDPFGDRDFIGDQIEGIMMFGQDGRPAFYNMWPEGTDTKDMKEINLNIVMDVKNVSAKTKAEVEVSNCGISLGSDSKGNDKCLGNQTLEQAFAPLDTEYVAMVQKYAAYFKSRFGMDLRVSVNEKREDMPNIEIFGYKNGHTGTAAFAKLPPPTPTVEEYNNSRILVNTDSTSYKQIVDKDKKTTVPNYDERLADFSHELGHCFGLAHPHDDNSVQKLSLKGYDTKEKLKVAHHSVMSYSQLRYISNDADVKNSAEWVGPMDLFLRNFMPNPPNPEKWNGGYNLDGFRQSTTALNPDKAELSSLSIYHDGKASKLSGISTPDSLRDVIDANAGYCGKSSVVEDRNKMKTTLNLPICFVNGKVNEIKTYKGHDKVTLPEGGGVFLDMGEGLNQVRALYRDLGNITIQTSGGDDRLYINKDVLIGRKVVPAEKKGLFVLDFVDERDGSHVGSITLPKQLKGNGITKIAIVEENGTKKEADGKITFEPAIVELEVKNLRSVQDWRYKVCNPLLNQFREEKWIGPEPEKNKAEAVVAAPGPLPKSPQKKTLSQSESIHR